MTGLAPARVTRRGAVGGAAIGLAVAGCQLDPPPPAAPAGGATSGSPAPDPDPDAALVETMVGELSEVLALVSGGSRSRRGLAEELRPWRLMHAAHLEALDAEVVARPPRVRGGVRAVRERILAREARLQRQLAHGAVAARSGAVASLLASMAAAVAQQLAAASSGAAG